jgi:hypothetical protein
MSQIKEIEAILKKQFKVLFLNGTLYELFLEEI